MRLLGLISEAFRNVATGTSRTASLAIVVCAISGGLSVSEVVGINLIYQGQEVFRASGADIFILESQGTVDPARCESLAGTSGIEAAGAIRRAPDAALRTLPGSPAATFEASRGLEFLLFGAPGAGDAGLWVSSALAGELGIVAGDDLAIGSSIARVDAVFSYPEDGRDGLLNRALVSAVPTTGSFDACWVRVWPADPELVGLMTLALQGTGESPTVSQLNSSLGEVYATGDLLRGRVTRYAAVFAFMVGAFVGAASARLRRLEIASALHAGVARHAVALQHTLECLTWVMAGLIIASPALVWAYSHTHSEALPFALLAGLRVMALAGLGPVLGAASATLLTRESHLFHYFKDR